MTIDPTARFGDRVANYIQYRPSYPPVMVARLEREAGLRPGGIVADIGSGTGKLSEVFLRAGYRVIGVEPNAPMREAAERIFSDEPRFASVAGRAEATTLEDASVDALLAGQAFHWFDPAKAREESLRILRPGGVAVLVWNDRRTDTTLFLRAYEALLLKRCPGYPVSEYSGDVASLNVFFGPAGRRSFELENRQHFDYEGLKGRLLSSSYAPTEGATHDLLLRDLARVFEEHAADGTVVFEYNTTVFYGPLR